MAKIKFLVIISKLKVTVVFLKPALILLQKIDQDRLVLYLV